MENGVCIFEWMGLFSKLSTQGILEPSIGEGSKHSQINYYYGIYQWRVNYKNYSLGWCMRFLRCSWNLDKAVFLVIGRRAEEKLGNTCLCRHMAWNSRTRPKKSTYSPIPPCQQIINTAFLFSTVKKVEQTGVKTFWVRCCVCSRENGWRTECKSSLNRKWKGKTIKWGEIRTWVAM